MNNLSCILKSTHASPQFQFQKVRFSLRSLRPFPWAKTLIAGGLVAAGVVTLATPVFAYEMNAHPHKLPWAHNGALAAYDHASVRRGYQVYKEVCSACHSMKYLAYRHLVNAVLSEQEAKAAAAEINVRDGPDDTGEMFDRPGRLTDYLPCPYPNTEAARAANNGAAPPDLTYVIKARHGNEDYVYHLLTGYCDPPPGRTVGEGQYYNPYFPGQAISMAPPLYNEMIEYLDGTPATASQMAKDVVSFLTWSSDRNHDQRKRILFKVLIVCGIFVVIVGYAKRKRWSNLKTRKLAYKNRPMPRDI